MSSEELLLFLHVTAVIVWLGANTVLDLLFLRAERMHDPQEMGRLGQMQEWLTPRLFIPASVATVVTGALLVWDSPWSFSDLWVLVGLGGWIATFATGLFFLKPNGERLEALGPGPEAAKIARRLVVVARFQLLFLFVIVAVMVLKPTGDDVWTLAVLGAILAAAAAASVAALRRGAPEAPPVAEPTG